MGDGTVDGFEALVRWEHPERGLLFPDAFVDVVEQTSLLAPMTVQVIEQALAHCSTLEDAGVAVNVSSASLSDPELVGAVEAALAHWGIAGSRLTVEITESAIIEDLPRAVALLERLRALGVRIAIDDYGTGHSSLAYLHRLPADELKIDRAFIADLDCDPRRAAIVRSTIELARDLGLCVVAEGVETEAAWRMLAALGCDMAQGYLIARPADPRASAAWLAGWRTSPPAWAAHAHAPLGR
jgi:diguanylate cyclase